MLGTRILRARAQLVNPAKSWHVARGMPRSLTLYVPEETSVRVIQCSPPSWMAYWVALEKGHQPRLVRLDFAKGEHKTSAMRALNPRGTIPVLEHDGHAVYETLAILSYLDDVLPGPELMPREPPARARALSLYHAAGELKNRGMAVFAYLMRNTPSSHDPTLEQLCNEMSQELGFWETLADERHYLAGEFSLVDCVVYPYLATARQLGFDLKAAAPRLARYCQRTAERPALIESTPRTWSEPLDVLKPYSP